MEENPKPKRHSFHFSLRILGSLFVLAILACTYILFISVQHALKAEHNLHATLFVIKIVERFVATHHRWPHSWEELEGEPIHDIQLFAHSEEDWPQVASIVRQEVSIDFTARPAEIAAQDPMEFSAIFPIGPYYEFRDYGEVKLLQQTCER